MESSIPMGELNVKDTELRLGLPGSEEPEKHCWVGSKRKCSPEVESTGKYSDAKSDHNKSDDDGPPAKAQVVGWPPVRSFTRNSVQQKKEEGGRKYVKVSMAGAAYLRKIDLKVYKSYPRVLKALENMFKCTLGEYSEREGYNGSEYVPTYKTKKGTGCLLEMFHGTCLHAPARGSESSKHLKLRVWVVYEL